MSDLMPYEGRSLMRRTESRQLTRALGGLSASVSLERVQIEAAAEAQALRAEAVTYVGRRAMQDLARLTRLEQELAMMAPSASGRLQVIGDITAFAVAEVVSDTLKRVR